ncbi:hypothetical protein N2152v2_007115 [Parachlorella kessleri]
MTIATAPYRNVFDLARAYPLSHSVVFNRLFEVSVGHPRCRGTPALTEKYGVPEDNSQVVVSITDRVTLSQAWYNEARTQKPQTFSEELALRDPTDGGRTCDFCDWQAAAVAATGKEATGDIQRSYQQQCENGNCGSDEGSSSGTSLGIDTEVRQQEPPPQHGQAGRRGQLHPLFLWNCLPRAGASQFHGHAQVMLSSSPFPAIQQEREAAACYDAVHQGSGSYYRDLLAAYEAVGLLRQAGTGGDRAFCYPSLTPTKDMEVCIQGSHMCSPAFQLLLYVALRALIDKLGVKTFNAAIYNVSLQGPGRAGVLGQQGQQQAQQPGSVEDMWAAGEPMGPVLARVVSRGKPSSQASDFGGLEVFGGASIAHTDPWMVAQALDAVLEQHSAL